MSIFWVKQWQVRLLRTVKGFWGVRWWDWVYNIYTRGCHHRRHLYFNRNLFLSMDAAYPCCYCWAVFLMGPVLPCTLRWKLWDCANERVNKARKLRVRYASQREIGRLPWQYLVDLDNTHCWRKLSGAQLSFDVATETPSYLSTELLRLHPFNKRYLFLISASDSRERRKNRSVIISTFKQLNPEVLNLWPKRKIIVIFPLLINNAQLETWITYNRNFFLSADWQSKA